MKVVGEGGQLKGGGRDTGGQFQGKRLWVGSVSYRSVGRGKGGQLQWSWLLVGSVSCRGEGGARRWSEVGDWDWEWVIGNCRFGMGEVRRTGEVRVMCN